ncbi:unnamed protein product [Rhodiola kirilowii]
MRLGRALPQLRAALCLRVRCSNYSFPPRHVPSSLATSTPVLIRHASSSLEPNPKSQNQNQKDTSVDPDYVSIQDVKGLIEKYDEGDMDAIPSIFEAILKRKLVQKKNNLESDPDLEQLVEDRRLDMKGGELDSSMEDEDLDDDEEEEEETDLDSDWKSDEEK